MLFSLMLRQIKKKKKSLQVHNNQQGSTPCTKNGRRNQEYFNRYQFAGKVVKSVFYSSVHLSIHLLFIYHHFFQVTTCRVSPCSLPHLLPQTRCKRTKVMQRGLMLQCSSLPINQVSRETTYLCSSIKSGNAQ